MKSRTGTRFRWRLAILAVVCLAASSSFAADTRLVFHLARVDYVEGTLDCDQPSAPIAKLIKTAAGDPAELQMLLATKAPKGDPCAQILKAEIQLAIKVLEYLQGQGIAVIFHVDEAQEVEQQLGRIRSPGDDNFLLHCVLTPNDSNANQLDATCTIRRLHSNWITVDARMWHHDKPPLDKLVDRFNEETSAKVTELCKGRMPQWQQGHR